MSAAKLGMDVSSEFGRIQALQRYDILDSAPEDAYDDVVKIASSICGTPIALISLVDDERQWFKAKIGIDTEETGRDVAFCDHAIRNVEDVLEIPDARVDHRFSKNPLVVGDPNVVFYAGAPLVTKDGHALGTLCVIDEKERKLNRVQLEALQALSRQVMSLLELRRTSNELKQSNDDLKNFAYIASHDLRAPLRAIDQLSAFIQEDAGDVLPDQSSEDLKTIRARVSRLDLMLEGLLTYSRLGRENREPHDLNTVSVLQQSADLVVPTDRFAVNVSVEIPSIKAPDVIAELVFRNLFSNAVKHHDREKGSISVRGHDNGTVVVVEFEDDGPGIPAEYRERVFNLFSTLKSRDELEASGMGLALVKRAMETLGGRVMVAPRDGRGAVIRTEWARAA